ncbi:hypothetical protein OG292_31685 [Streptomyces sp. NBC_01511]|uniref:hypothetical protein n=1 Tax=unclassified Streptomyces TaxID=2593676 RepID=UPI0038678ED5
MITEKDVGQRVEDGAGRVGILRDVIKDYEDPAELPGERQKRHAAFLSPEGGGLEWIVSPASVALIP